MLVRGAKDSRNYAVICDVSGTRVRTPVRREETHAEAGATPADAAWTPGGADGRVQTPTPTPPWKSADANREACRRRPDAKGRQVGRQGTPGWTPADARLNAGGRQVGRQPDIITQT